MVFKILKIECNDPCCITSHLLICVLVEKVTFYLV